MLTESSYLDAAGVRKFFIGFKTLREKEGVSLEEIAENTGLDYKQLHYLELWDDTHVTLPINDALLTRLAEALGYNQLEDIVNAV